MICCRKMLVFAGLAVGALALFAPGAARADVVFVEYIKSTRAQRIVTDYTPSPKTWMEINLKMEGEFYYTGKRPADGTSAIFNTPVGSANVEYSANFGGQSNQSHELYVWPNLSYGKGGSICAKVFADDTIMSSNTLTFCSGSLTWGSESMTPAAKTTTCQNPLALFGTATKNYDAYEMTVWSWKIYESDDGKKGGPNQVLVRDFAPAVKDGAAGLYDRVTGQFYANAGTGADFTVGFALGSTLTVTGVPFEYGTVTPAYGMVTPLEVGETRNCQAPASVEDLANGLRATCAGYKVYTNGVVMASGTENAFTYTHPDSPTGPVLTWLWNVSCRVTLGATEHGTATGAGWYASGSSVSLTATPDAGCIFAGWTGDGVTDANRYSNPLVFAMGTSGVTITPTFRPYVNVSPTGKDDTGDGSAGKPFATIEKALSVALARDTIFVQAGTYPITNDLTVTTANLTVMGEDPATGLPACDSVILDGGYPARTNRIFYINAANVTLKGLTMRNAMLYRQNGGAVYVNATGFAMTNCVIRDSIAQYGAGLYAAEACHGIVDCVFTNNFASGFGSGYGFGAGAYFSKAATVRKCLFVEGEVMTEGGGCYCNGAFAFTDCTFTNNMTQTTGSNQKGGAFYCNGTAGAFTNCQFLGNYAKENGSACFLNKNATFEKCRFVGNRGGQWGTIYTGANSQKIYNSYFSHNGGSALSSIGVGGGSVVSNCVFENQTSTDAKGDRGVVGMSSGSGRINVTHCRFYNVYSSSFIDENTDINCCVFTNITMTFVFGRSTNKIRNSLFTGNPKPVLLANCTYENCSFVTNAAGPAVSLMNGNVTSPKLTNCVFWANAPYTTGGYRGNMGLLLAKSNDFDATNRVKMANCVLQSNTETSAYAPDMRLADKTGETARLTALAIEKGPRFVDPKNGDWRLKRNSPLRDAGVKHDWMTGATDLDGLPRCLGRGGLPTPAALPDVGCYECAIPKPGAALILR